MRDHFGVGLAGELIAASLQLGTQLVVVFNDAVVDQGNAPETVGRCVRTMGKMRMCVVNGRRAMRGPTRMRNAGARRDTVFLRQPDQLGHPRGAARTQQTAALMHRHAAGVIAAVFKALEPFDQNRDDIALTDGADDATHMLLPMDFIAILGFTKRLM